MRFWALFPLKRFPATPCLNTVGGFSTAASPAHNTSRTSKVAVRARYPSPILTDLEVLFGGLSLLDTDHLREQHIIGILDKVLGRITGKSIGAFGVLWLLTGIRHLVGYDDCRQSENTALAAIMNFVFMRRVRRAFSSAQLLPALPTR